ncbi:MAG: lycopene cyclase domain-containing protein [Schleiferiaceae bacterium]
MKGLYLLMMGLTFLGPFTRAFEPRIRYIGQTKHLLVGTLFMMALFIPWDVVKTASGVWGFNPRYLVGPSLWGLPLEEWLFFVVVPWATFFIYEVLQLFFPWRNSKPSAFALVGTVGLASLVLAVVYADRWYTLTAAGGLAVGCAWLLWKRPWWTAAFLRGWGVGLVPFFLVNGVLTGAFLPEPIVWYNDAENMGIRMGTIPVEDALYGTFMMIMYAVGVHWSRERR